MKKNSSFLASLILATAMASLAAAQGGNVTVEVTNLTYGPDSAQSLDLYTPQNLPPDPMPVVVLAHGGLWRGGDKSELSTLCTNIVVESGGTVACASINYRLSQNLGGVCSEPGQDTYREQLVDMASAFVKLQNEAGVHGLDATWMYVGGHSAGGHLGHELNLRWGEFAQSCANPSGCPPAIGAIGFEGIYDIAAWDAYDASFWGGRFACATRSAFGAPPGSGSPCIETESGLACWDVGSPVYLAQSSVALGISSVGDALIIHSPGDDWVDIDQATDFGAAMSAAFANISIIMSTDGTCATGQHKEPLTQTILATCILDFVALGEKSAEFVPFLPLHGLALLAIVLAAAGGRALKKRDPFVESRRTRGSIPDRVRRREGSRDRQGHVV